MLTFLGLTTSCPDKRYNQNNGAMALFNYLCNLEIIGAMIYNTAQGLPAVAGIPQSVLDEFYSDPDFPLSKGSNRQCVGKMIAYIMSLYGYTPFSKKDIQKRGDISSVFSSGHVYKKK